MAELENKIAELQQKQQEGGDVLALSDRQPLNFIQLVSVRGGKIDQVFEPFDSVVFKRG